MTPIETAVTRRPFAVAARGASVPAYAVAAADESALARDRKRHRTDQRGSIIDVRA